MTPLTSSAGGGDPQRVGPFRVLRVLSEVGSHATCIAARESDDPSSGRSRRERVILRVVSVADPTKRALVAASFRWSMAIGDERILPVIEAGTDGSRVYAALLEGAATPLAPLCTPSLPADIVASIGLDVSLGLHVAHQHQGRRLVHHALSIDALVVDRVGRALVEGIFVAPAVAGETNSELPLWLASPEWVACGPFDARSDVYALGAILWSMLAGRPLFENLASPSDLLKLIRRSEIAPPSSVAPNVPPALEAAIMDALKRDPRDRPASMADLAARLRGSIDTSAARARLAQIVRPGPPSVPRPTGQPARVPRPIPPRVMDEESSESDATIVEKSPFFDTDDTTGVSPGRLDRAPAPGRALPIVDEGTDTDTGDDSGDDDAAGTRVAARPRDDDDDDADELPRDESTDGSEDEATTIMPQHELQSAAAALPMSSSSIRFGRVTTKMVTSSTPASPEEPPVESAAAPPTVADPPAIVAEPPPPFSWPTTTPMPVAQPRVVNLQPLVDDESEPPAPPLGIIPAGLPAPMEPSRAFEAARPLAQQAPVQTLPQDRPRLPNWVLIVLVILTFVVTAAITALFLTRR